MKKLPLLLLVVVLLATAGCIRDAGPLTTETRTIDDFDAINLEGSADIYITQDPEYELKIQAGENHLEYIRTEVENGVLTVDEKRNRIWIDEGVKIWVSVDFLSDITIEGSGDIEGGGITLDNFDLNIKGSGDVDLSFTNVANTIETTIDGSGDVELDGDVAQLNVTIDGSGDFDGRQLYADDVTVDIDGSGDVRVWATNSLSIDIAGSGDVHYWGSPGSVNTNVSGSGDIIKH